MNAGLERLTWWFLSFSSAPVSSILSYTNLLLFVQSVDVCGETTWVCSLLHMQYWKQIQSNPGRLHTVTSFVANKHFVWKEEWKSLKMVWVEILKWSVFRLFFFPAIQNSLVCLAMHVKRLGFLFQLWLRAKVFNIPTQRPPPLAPSSPDHLTEKVLQHWRRTSFKKQVFWVLKTFPNGHPFTREPPLVEVAVQPISALNYGTVALRIMLAIRIDCASFGSEVWLSLLSDYGQAT